MSSSTAPSWAISPTRGTWPNIKGSSIKKPYPAVSSQEIANDRFILRNTWNNNNYKNAASKGFKANMNISDPLFRKNYSCNGPNPLSSTRPGMVLITTRDGVKSKCDDTNIPAASGNVKYVSDASTLIKYKRLVAINRSYTFNSIPKSKPNYGFVYSS